MPNDEAPLTPSQEPQPKQNETPAIQGEPVLEEVINKLPPEVKTQITTLLLHQRIGSQPNPIFNKINEGHIGQLLTSAENDSVRDHELAKSGRWFHLAYALLALLFLVFIIWYLPTIDKDLFKLVITAIVSLAGGFGGGYGYSKYKEKKGDD
jgi:hypothetical protein